MRIEVAKSAGFCFGAKRAVDMVQELLHRGEKAATLGALLHNPQLVEELEAKGVKVVDAPRDTPEGHVLVLRSHGVTLEVEREIERLGLRFADATCPFVKKIHHLAGCSSEENRTFILFGDPGHPEVKGTVSHCKGPYFVCRDHSELQNLLKDHAELTNVPIAAAAQTTFHMGEWEKCLETLKKVCTNAAVFDTICNATAKRQKEALDLAGKCDVMIVIGGRDSSNTAKLGDICARQCRTYLIEKASELPTFPAGLSVGITAGASTPASIIKEVLVTMAEVNSTEQNFEEMLEESLKSMNTDEKVHGVVVGISPTEVYVDVGRKQAGFIPAAELSTDPSVKPEDVVKMGDEMELLIMKTNDQEGTIMLSKRRVDAMMAEGLLDEVKSLREMGCERRMVSMQGLGYKELLSYLDGEITLREAVDAIKQNTRHFAKRQLTWFRRERDVIWVNKNEFHYNKEEILHYLSEQCRAKKSVPQ